MTKRNNVATQVKQALDEVELEASQPGSISSLSSRAQQVRAPEVPVQVQMALEALRHAPEARYELVERIRAEIEAGTYQIDNVLIARKLLGVSPFEAGEASQPEAEGW